MLESSKKLAVRFGVDADLIEANVDTEKNVKILGQGVSFFESIFYFRLGGREDGSNS